MKWGPAEDSGSDYIAGGHGPTGTPLQKSQDPEQTLALTQPHITQGLAPKDTTAPLGIPTSLGHAESVGGTAGTTPVS